MTSFSSTNPLPESTVSSLIQKPLAEARLPSNSVPAVSAGSVKNTVAVSPDPMPSACLGMGTGLPVRVTPLASSQYNVIWFEGLGHAARIAVVAAGLPV